MGPDCGPGFESMGSRILDTSAKPPRVLVLDSFKLDEDMDNVRELPLPAQSGIDIDDDPLDVPIGEKEKGPGVGEVHLEIAHEGKVGDQPEDTAAESDLEDEVPPDTTARAIAQQRSWRGNNRSGSCRLTRRRQVRRASDATSCTSPLTR